MNRNDVKRWLMIMIIMYYTMSFIGPNWQFGWICGTICLFFRIVYFKTQDDLIKLYQKEEDSKKE